MGNWTGPGRANVILEGKNDAGNAVQVPVDANGHLEVALHHPRLPFGSINTESLYPIFQTDAVYGIDGINLNSGTTVDGTATASDSNFICTTGSTIYGSGFIQSRKRLRYRPGQGAVVRFTGLFTTGVAQSFQVIGCGHAEDGVYFGYSGASFGILYERRGVREVQTLTITTGSSHAETITITLNGTAFSGITVTASGSTTKTAYEIASHTFAGWKVEQIGATVLFVSDSVGDKTDTFEITTATSVVGTFAETKAGAATSQTFIAQTAWNGDTMDGSGDDGNPSGFQLDPTKYNVFQINIQYLGAGVITFQIEATSDSNNANFVTVHSLKLPNTLTTTSFGNPSFPFTMSAYSAGSTTDLTIKSGSFAGFIEGVKTLQGSRFSYYGQKSSTVASGAYYPLFTIRNTRYFSGRTNQSVINLQSISGAVQHNKPVTIYIFRNATLAGTPSFSQYATSSCSYVDTAATTCTIASNSQILWSQTLGETGDFNFTFPQDEDLTIQPGETITIAARSVSATATEVIAALNTREDQ